MKPRRAAGRRASRTTVERIRLPLESEVDADRALVSALRRNSVNGAVGLECLTAIEELLLVIRRAGGHGFIELRLVAEVMTVRLELDVTNHLASVAEWLVRSADFPAARWGTLHEQRRTTLWADIGRRAPAPANAFDSGVRHSESWPDGPIDPIEVLAEVMVRLAAANSLAEVAEIVEGPLRAQLDASTTDLAMRDGYTVSPVTADYPSTEPATPPAASPGRLRTAIEAPIAAAARDGEFRGFATPWQADREFPGVGSRLRASRIQALAAVPLTVAGQPIGALAVGWQGARPVDELRPLLMIVAKHAADAAIRVTSLRPDGTAMARDGSRALGNLTRRAEAAGGSLRLDLVSRSAIVAGRSAPVRLTGREFELLHFLVRHSGTIQSRHDTLREVWGIGFTADTSVVDVTISRLRRKLGTDAIITVRDQGYLIPA